MLLNLACDDDNNDGGSGDKATPDPKSTIIPVPENLSSDETSSTDGAYDLSWDSVSGATTYKLREGKTELELSSDDIQNRTHSVTGKDTGSYNYQVQACDASGVCSEWSGAITVHVFTSDPPTLTLSDETRGTDGAYRSIDGTYDLSWNSLGEDVTYELQENETDLELSSDAALTHSVTPAKTTGSYEYQMRACHANGVCSEWSSITVHVFRASAPALTLTLTSTETRATDGSYGSVDGIYTLTWNEVTDAASYELEEGQEGNAESYTEIYSGPGRTSEADPTRRTHSIDTQPGGSYNYRVRACHMNTACTAWSNTFSLSVSRNCAGDSAQASGFQDGDGSSDSPFLICDYTQLKKMGENDDALTKHYKLGKDIDASRSRSDGVQRDGGRETCRAYDPTIDEDDSPTPGHPGYGDTCTGWTPVGNSTTEFTGSLQGAGYEIQNLYINIRTGATRVGLFGETGGASVIQNVGLTDAYIKVDTVEADVGGLVGYNAGSISKIYATGSVIRSNDITGGLAGRNAGSISNSYATTEVTGSRSYSGGLVGWNGGSISNSYATGDVNSDFGARLGGLVGGNEGSISNSYATGNPNSITVIGGLVGWMNAGGSISNSYATGDVTNASAYSGGLVGWMNAGGSISNSYAAGSVSGRDPDVGGLVGVNAGESIGSGKNYFVDSDGTRGIGSGTACAAANCSRAGDDTTITDDQRRTWLQDTLDESLSTDMGGMGWLPANWEGFVGTGVGYPKLLYAQVAGYCNDGSDKNESDCKASGSCSGTSSDSSYTREGTCTADGVGGTWTPNAWLAGGDECGGTTGVACGTRIGGQ